MRRFFSREIKTLPWFVNAIHKNVPVIPHVDVDTWFSQQDVQQMSAEPHGAYYTPTVQGSEGVHMTEFTPTVELRLIIGYG